MSASQWPQCPQWVEQVAITLAQCRMFIASRNGRCRELRISYNNVCKGLLTGTNLGQFESDYACGRVIGVDTK